MSLIARLAAVAAGIMSIIGVLLGARVYPWEVRGHRRRPGVLAAAGFLRFTRENTEIAGNAPATGRRNVQPAIRRLLAGAAKY
jgi:hypothetical protein